MDFYKIGDRVRISEKLRDYCLYIGDNYSNYLARHFIGKEATILSVDWDDSVSDYVYKLDIDNGAHFWSDSVFEPISDENPKKYFTLYDFSVELINKEEVKSFVKNHGEFACVCYNTDESKANGVGKKCLQSGHLSGSRSDSFKFKITVVPRFEVDQAVRHEVGVSKNVQSLRYVNKDDFRIYIPREIEERPDLLEATLKLVNQTQLTYNKIVDTLVADGVTQEHANEVARTILPIGIESAYSQSFTLEALAHFCNVRLCTRAEEPIRRVAKLMVEAVQEVTHAYDEFLVPKCKLFGYCTEDHCCGRAPTKKDFEIIYQDVLKQFKNLNK